MQNLNEIDEIEETGAQKREPIFNLPGVILFLAGLILAVHALRDFILTDEQDNLFVYMFAFIPAAYGPLGASAPYPEAIWWSPVTHSFLHGDWMHVAMNLVWMAAFGTPVARRFGTFRFLILTVLCSCGGALLHYLTVDNPFVLVIGASGAVSGYMGAASRFIFLNMKSGLRFKEDGPSMSLIQSFRNRQFLIFFGVWMGINYIFGAGFVDITGQGALIAWQAHIGGFLVGLLVFGLLDPIKHRET